MPVAAAQASLPILPRLVGIGVKLTAGAGVVLISADTDAHLKLTLECQKPAR